MVKALPVDGGEHRLALRDVLGLARIALQVKKLLASVRAVEDELEALVPHRVAGSLSVALKMDVPLGVGTVHHGKQAATLKLAIGGRSVEHSEEVGDRRRQVDEVGKAADPLTRRPPACWKPHDQRDPHARLVELNHVADVAVLAQRLTVIRGHDHDRVLPDARSLEQLAKLAELLMGPSS